MDWPEFAACRDHDTELFFPLAEDGAEATAALFVCGTCPVRSQCLSYALEAGEVGIWGGTTETDRRALRRAA